jgi:AraC family transcriptional regulator, positive regulator of tynA and feaB
MHRMSTAGVPPQQRLSFWNDACMGVYGATVVDADPAGFEGVLTTIDADHLQIASVMSTPAVCRKSLNRQSCPDETSFSLQIVHSGRCRIDHAGIRSFGLPGDMFVADGNRSYELAFGEPIKGLVLSPPWSRFRAYAGTLEAIAGRPMNVASGPGAVLSSFIRTAWEQLADGDEEQWPQSATDVIWDLLEAALEGQRVPDTSIGRPDRLRRNAGILVDENFRDVAFQSSNMAAALGVSARYLQMVFAQAGSTPSRFLLERRLDAVASRLRCVDTALRITDVALECGFSDLSYFSRMFRRRFGMSARAFRQSQ